MLICLLFSLILIGWGFAFANLLKTNLSIGLFNAAAFCSLIIFFSFIAKTPLLAAKFILCFGILFLIYFLTKTVGKRNKMAGLHDSFVTIFCYLFLCALAFFIAFGMKFRSIDDYSFWGVISKYLFIFQELPKNDAFISMNFLSYTPLLASFHYLLFTLGRKYSAFYGYYAQALFMISAMMVLFNPRDLTRSIFSLCLWYILLTLAYGLAFARMEVDAYVATYFFIICWCLYKNGQKAITSVFIPILALSLIKEIGLLFALGSILLCLIIEKPKLHILVKSFLLLFVVLLAKFMWKWHVFASGFYSFSKAITLDSALSALNPFNDYYHRVQLLFLKEISLAHFDKILRIPYIFSYLFIFGLYYWMKRNHMNDLRIKKIMGLFVFLAIYYLLMLYFLQAIVFQVGHENAYILDFARYFNMLFLPWLALFVFIAVDKLELKFATPFNSKSLIIIVFAFAFLIAGKIERTRKFYAPEDLPQIRELIKEKTAHLKNPWTVCLTNIPEPTYKILMPLTYFFLPNRVSESTMECQVSIDLLKQKS